jgi:hypothetical protein
MTDETITLDPVEFVPERTELGLDAMGIRVREAEWGDSEHEMFMVRQALGEIPADRHPPNRTVTLKLAVEENAAVSLAKAAQLLQKKAGLIQREGGFVRRDLDSDSSFEGPVATRVHSIGLGGIHGWLMAHRKRAPEVTLTMVTDPYFYGVEEIETNLVKGENTRRLEYELPKIKGSAPGLIRVLVKNEGTEDWNGLLHSLESRDSSGASTAKMFYEAEALTLAGKAALATRSGGSGGEANNVVKSGSLSNTWVAILSSKTGSGHMTHVGTRRLLLRVYDPSSVPDQVKLKLEWRALGTNKWSSNDVKSAPLTGNFSVIDMGECIPAQAVLGDQRWEWRLLAKTEGSIGDEIQIDTVMIPSTEQYLLVKELSSASEGGTVIWEDTFIQSEGSATGKTAPIGGTYEGAGDTDDFKVSEPASSLSRIANSDSTVNNGRYLVAGSSKAAYTSVKGSIDNRDAPYGSSTRAGILARYIDKDNWLRVSFYRDQIFIEGSPPLDGGRIIIEKCVAGVVTQLAISGKATKFAFGGDLFVTVDTAGKITAKSQGSSHGAYTTVTAEDEVFATGKTLAEGKVGFYDGMATAAAGSTLPRYYSGASASTASAALEAEEADAVCFENREIELRTDGVFRQHNIDNVWGKLVPIGFLPYAPPEGLEERAARGILVPTAGDFGVKADSGSHKLSCKVLYFPGYHFTSEAV